VKQGLTMKNQQSMCRCLTSDDPEELHRFAGAFTSYMKAARPEPSGPAVQDTRTPAGGPVKPHDRSQ